VFPIRCGQSLSHAIVQVFYYSQTYPTFNCRFRSVSVGLTLLWAICNIRSLPLVRIWHSQRGFASRRPRISSSNSISVTSSDMAFWYVIFLPRFIVNWRFSLLDSARTRRHLPVGDRIDASFSNSRSRFSSKVECRRRVYRTRRIILPSWNTRRLWVCRTFSSTFDDFYN
jgi:hypothetical protein